MSSLDMLEPLEQIQKRDSPSGEIPGKIADALEAVAKNIRDQSVAVTKLHVTHKISADELPSTTIDLTGLWLDNDKPRPTRYVDIVIDLGQ